MTRRSSADGFSLIELLVATLILVTVVGAVFALIAPSRATFDIQPEVHDLQQRLRVVAGTLHRELIGAGAGIRSNVAPGPLHNVLAPVLPYRFASADSDDRTPRADSLSLMYIGSEVAQATVRTITHASPYAIVQVEPNCGVTTRDAVCGFTQGLPVIVLDATGRHGIGTVIDVDGEFVIIDGDLPGSGVLPSSGAVVAGIDLHHYWLDPPRGSQPPRLMHFDGRRTVQPVVDHVVAFALEYFGDPSPPAMLAGADVTRVSGPWTTYGPRPPPADQDDPRDEWEPGGNCVFTAPAGVHTPRLALLAASRELVQLPLSLFSDGPWCPDASHPRRFDADLLRIRRVRVALRVEAGDDGLRGPRGPLFVRGGSGVRGLVPDQSIWFDVAPRNMNLSTAGS